MDKVNYAILLSNDDGYDAPGIQLLKQFLLQLGHHVRGGTAPKHEWKSCSLTLDVALITKSSPMVISKWLTPADCVHLASVHLARVMIRFVLELMM